MRKFIRIGIDLGKNYFQVHALESEDRKATTRKLSRLAMRKFFSEIDPCLVGMEACASSHYWARELLAMGHDVRLIPPIYVKPYVKRGKNDAADAAAVCEAMSRPGMRFVPVKSEENQATLMLHRARQLLIKQQTMSVNALRGHLAEFGIVASKGIGRVDELVEKAENDANSSVSRHSSSEVVCPTSGSNRRLYCRSRPPDIERSCAKRDQSTTGGNSRHWKDDCLGHRRQRA